METVRDIVMDNQADDKKDKLDRLCKLALDKDVLNIINAANEGRPLTPYQRRFLERLCGVVDRQEVLDALAILREAVCEECEGMVERLMENLKCREN